MSVDAVLAEVDRTIDQSVQRLFALLRIESISTDPAYKEACRAAADWLVADLAEMGFEAARHDTPGHPMVVGQTSGGGRILFYGHYDVQPVDPLELWHRGPFDPVIEDTPQGKVIRARGASDDKGQLMTFVEACRAWKAAKGALPAGLTILFEGEEESGSPSLVPFLEAQKDTLRAEIALVCDTGMLDARTPAITTMLRGMAQEDFTIRGPDRDLHSGMYGGPAINPIRVLTRVLGTLHDEAGRVTLPGFYDGVPELPDAVRTEWQGLGVDPAAFLGDVGLSTLAGEAGYSLLEQTWARPTAEINGISGGYTGKGFKTVLPAEASAKVSFRLVGDQDPVKIQAAFRAHIEAGLPPDCTVEFRGNEGARATTMPIDAAPFAKARDALTAEWETPAVFVGSGGSIPIVGHFASILGMDSVLIGFGLEDDNIHSPNEKYSLTSFHKGIRSWVRVLDALDG
ncbi:MAG: M20/M25/M40 family metallo-hydrolase [Pseudomonadota bacterium]